PVAFLMYRPLRDIGDARTFVERGAHALDALEQLKLSSGQDVSPSDSASDRENGLRSTRTPVRTRRTPPWQVMALEVDELVIALDSGITLSGPTTFRADGGQIVAIVGPTGIGKTTLLRGLLGLEAPLRGRARYGGIDITRAGVGPEERPFAWVPQEPAIVAGTVRDNVALGAADAETALEALRAVGGAALARRADERVTAGGPELSGGERQWIALARAIASAQPVLLLDEPTAGLDGAAQRRVL